jgi:hypothetical protein
MHTCFQPGLLFLILAWHVCLDRRLLQRADIAVNSQYASTQIFWLIAFENQTNRVHSKHREWSWPKHNVTEEIMMLAYDMRSEATLLIGSRAYPLKRQPGVRYQLGVLRWQQS